MASTLRTIRSESFVPSATLQAIRATIIGCGAVGAQVARMLSAMGAQHLNLQDMDVVSEENLGPQQWPHCALTLPKTDALIEIARSLNPDISLASFARFPDDFDPIADEQFRTPVVFACVDDMDIRQKIYQSFRGNCFRDVFPPLVPPILIDTRMAAFYYEVHAVLHEPASLQTYRKTLFPQSEADVVPCTARATAYCANMCAAAAVHTLIEHIRGNRPAPIIKHDLFSWTLPQ